jgi:hypothetical protein
MDQSKKTMRHFYCKDALWDIFEQMANDFDCSIDYLINEGMRYYARSKNYAPNQGAGGTTGQTGGQPSINGGPPPATARPPAGAPPTQGGQPPPQGRRPPPPPVAGQPTGPAYSARRTIQRSGRQPAVDAGQRPPPGARPGMEPAAGAGPTLFLLFNNQRIPVDKDQFIIGRGSKTSDLAIKDGNISRKHAAIIRRNGTYYIKDLGSTNGIDYKGMRIDNKRIDEGDVFHLCDYELRFTYRG